MKKEALEVLKNRRSIRKFKPEQITACLLYTSIIDGLYMEGPFMNPKYGSEANDVKWHGAIDTAVMQELVDYAGKDVRVWCVAPERDDIETFVLSLIHI